jgi:glycosyltransferase involved in cell wall biosynthesis
VSSNARRRLQIAFVSDGLYAYGNQPHHRRFHELAGRLTDRHEVHYFTWRLWDGPADIFDSGVLLHGVADPPDGYEAGGQLTRRDGLGFARRLMAAITGRGFDVIDFSATPSLSLYAAGLGAWLAESPLVVTWHEVGAEGQGEPARAGWKERLVQATSSRTLRLARQHVAVSPVIADQLVEAGMPADRISVIGNGLELDAFDRAPTSAVESDIVFVGHLVEEKGVDLLIEAVARLRVALPQLRCLVIGDGPHRPALEALVAARDLAKQVWFMGHVEEVEKISLLKASKILVLPALREGFATAAVEGQAAGLVPVVVRSQQSAGATMIHDGVDGLVCDPTPDALADALHALLGDPFRLALMRAAAGVAVRRRDWQWVTQQMELMYLDAARPDESQEARARRLSWG